MNLEPENESAIVLADDRSQEVLTRIMEIKGDLMERSLELGRLLKEARDNDYAQRWGYPRFGSWVESASGLDLSERSAYYLIRVVERTAELGIPDEVVKQVKISALKEICALPDDTDPDRVRELINEAQTLSLKSVREVVGALKNQEWVMHHIKMSREAEDAVYQPAMERIRNEYGDTVGPDGSPEDITESRGIEMILADYIASPAEEEYEIAEGEFVDVIECGTEERAAD